MYQLPDLPYSYNALEPYIDEETMHFHHDKHHGIYVKNLNEALFGQDKFLNLEIEDLIKNLSQVPEDLRTKVENNGCQHFNHSFFWTVMGPSAKQNVLDQSGKLNEVIDNTFGGLEKFKEIFSKSALSVFGSGWTWLVAEEDKLAVINTPNQKNPVQEGKIPLLVIDVWEHAYYLKYQNRRVEYITNWWNIVNWEEVQRRFNEIR